MHRKTGQRRDGAEVYTAVSVGKKGRAMNFLRRVGLLCCLSLPLHDAEPLQLRLLTEDFPPFSMQLADGRIGGLSSDIVREIMRRAGIGYRIELLPWVRAQQRGAGAEHRLLHRPHRAAQYQLKWIGPVVENQWYCTGATTARRS
jgi:polar amino acid transport system substrate-binding protein